MKNTLSVILSVVLMLSLALSGCAGDDSKTGQSNSIDKGDTAKNSVVIYFSCTGNTKALAEKVASATDSDIIEIAPEVPYTDADIDYNTDCRANKEQSDDTARPGIATKFDNLDAYDTVYIGYPIWWGTLPKIINTFLETYDLSQKTVMPFCTSGGSSISNSVSVIKKYIPNVKEGYRGTSSTTENDIKSWANIK